MPAAAILARTSPTTARADESQGSFCSIGAVKGYGYQVPPAACGARNAQPGWSSSGARVRMSRAVAPRPWTMTMAAPAPSSSAPAVRTGWPWCRSVTALPVLARAEVAGRVRGVEPVLLCEVVLLSVVVLLCVVILLDAIVLLVAVVLLLIALTAVILVEALLTQATVVPIEATLAKHVVSQAHGGVGHQDAAAHPECDLAGAGQEAPRAAAALLLVARTGVGRCCRVRIRLLSRRRHGRRKEAALLGLTGQARLRLLERALLDQQCLRHVVGGTRQALNALLDQRLGLGIARTGLGCALREPLKQRLDQLLLLRSHRSVPREQRDWRHP